MAESPPLTPEADLGTGSMRTARPPRAHVDASRCPPSGSPRAAGGPRRARGRRRRRAELMEIDSPFTGAILGEVPGRGGGRRPRL